MAANSKAVHSSSTKPVPKKSGSADLVAVVAVSETGAVAEAAVTVATTEAGNLIPLSYGKKGVRKRKPFFYSSLPLSGLFFPRRSFMVMRSPAVAGYFYPKDPRVLRDQIQVYMQEEESGGAQAQKVIALVSPHAGYMYSGRVAAAVFSRVKVPSRLFILSPNHTGTGTMAAINTEGKWITPLGEAEIEFSLAADFPKRCE